MGCGVVAITVVFISSGVEVMTTIRRWSLARQLFALQAVVVALVLVGVTLAAYLQAQDGNEQATGREMLAVAHTLAADPAVLAALDDADPPAVLQPLAERVRAERGGGGRLRERGDGGKGGLVGLRALEYELLGHGCWTCPFVLRT